MSFLDRFYIHPALSSNNAQYKAPRSSPPSQAFPLQLSARLCPRLRPVFDFDTHRLHRISYRRRKLIAHMLKLRRNCLQFRFWQDITKNLNYCMHDQPKESRHEENSVEKKNDEDSTLHFWHQSYK